jgi:hypothetical protein
MPSSAEPSNSANKMAKPCRSTLFFMVRGNSIFTRTENRPERLWRIRASGKTAADAYNGKRFFDVELSFPQAA